VSENLDLVRSVYEAWGRGDFGSTDWAHPDIEYTYADGINAATRVGLRGMGEGFRDWIGVFSDWTVKADDYIELDEDRVLVLYVSSARPKRSGPDTERLRSNGASLFEMRGRLVARIVQYADRDRALADLGLAE
jgi:ketosteroid isomerase-like protein